MSAINLPAEAENRLAAWCRATGAQPDRLVSDAVLWYLEEQEDIRLAEKRLADVRAGKEGVVPLRGLMRRYGVES